MDPNETLRLIRHQVNIYRKGYGFDPEAFVDAVDSLDDWLSKGGFLPDEWRWHEQH